MRTHDPKFMNDYLFVCRANLRRSATAEHVARTMGYRADSAGAIEVIAVRPLTLDQIEHAKHVILLEGGIVLKEFQKIAPNAVIHVWDIPDNWDYCHPELVTLLRNKIMESRS